MSMLEKAGSTMPPRGKLLTTPRKDEDGQKTPTLPFHLFLYLRPRFKESNFLGLLRVTANSQYSWLIIRVGGSPILWTWQVDRKGLDLRSEGGCHQISHHRATFKALSFCHVHAHTAFSLPSLRTMPKLSTKIQSDITDCLPSHLPRVLHTLTLASPSCPELENVLQLGGTGIRGESLVYVAVLGSGGSVSIDGGLLG